MMLHLIFQSPVALAILERIDSSDDVVFHEKAVWNTFSEHGVSSELRRLMAQNTRLHVLKDDLEVNGIDVGQLICGVEVIDYPELVELTIKNKVIKTWR